MIDETIGPAFRGWSFECTGTVVSECLECLPSTRVNLDFAVLRFGARVSYRILLLLLAMVHASIFCVAMDFSTEPTPSLSPNETILRAQGEIVDGDFSKFLSQIQKSPPTAKVLVITSGGGSVSEAIKIAESVKSLGFSVVADRECASACAQIIFPAGKYSILTMGSLLGIHSCSSDGNRSDLCNHAIAILAVSNGFPYGTIDMFADLYGPGEMKWMTEISARCFGFYRGSKDPKPISGRKACVDGYIYTANTTAMPRPFGPSFNCSRATTKVEKLICKDKELMQADSILGRVYDSALRKLVADRQTTLKKRQANWLKLRDAECELLIGSNLDFMATRPAALCVYSHDEDQIYELIKLGLEH